MRPAGLATPLSLHHTLGIGGDSAMGRDRRKILCATGIVAEQMVMSDAQFQEPLGGLGANQGIP